MGDILMLYGPPLLISGDVENCNTFICSVMKDNLKISLTQSDINIVYRLNYKLWPTIVLLCLLLPVRLPYILHRGKTILMYIKSFNVFSRSLTDVPHVICLKVIPPISSATFTGTHNLSNTDQDILFAVPYFKSVMTVSFIPRPLYLRLSFHY